MDTSSDSATIIAEVSKGDYSKLASHMGTWPEMAIFRKFAPLNAQDLLFRQAELAYLEDQVNELRQEDDTLDEKSRTRPSQYWRLLSEKRDGKHTILYQKCLEIREKLAEYNCAILRYHAVTKLNSPTRHDLRTLRGYLRHEDGGDNFLGAFEADAWDSERPDLERDLITTSDVHHERDLFSAWLGDNCTSWFEQRFGHWIKRKNSDVEGGMSHYNDTRLNAISRFIGTLLASMLPAVSIFVLYFVEDMLKRLGAIMAFSALFAFTLAVFTRATRIEIFAATAAFASVQVVFVGSTDAVGTQQSGLMI